MVPQYRYRLPMDLLQSFDGLARVSRTVLESDAYQSHVLVLSTVDSATASLDIFMPDIRLDALLCVKVP